MLGNEPPIFTLPCKENTMDIGPTELIIILLIVLLLFGVGRIGKLGGELGSGIRAFRKGIKGDEEEDKPQAEASVTSEIPSVMGDSTASESAPEAQDTSIKS
jgi:sec-independent protein translocase protein TatA